LAMMLVAPMMQLIILPLVANFDVKNINLVYIDHDQSTYSYQLIQKITASGYFKLVEAPFSYKEGIALIVLSFAYEVALKTFGDFQNYISFAVFYQGDLSMGLMGVSRP